MFYIIKIQSPYCGDIGIALFENSGIKRSFILNKMLKNKTNTYSHGCGEREFECTLYRFDCDKNSFLIGSNFSNQSLLPFIEINDHRQIEMCQSILN